MAKLITESRYHKTLNSTELIKRRESLGVSQAEFAEQCGWSPAYQCKLESPNLHEIGIKVADKIIAAFSELH